MHKNEKLNFEKITSANVLPKLTMDVVECEQCRYRIPVPEYYIKNTFN